MLINVNVTRSLENDIGLSSHNLEIEVGRYHYNRVDFVNYVIYKW